jgi:glutathione S-transferase
MGTGEHKRDPHISRNPFGQVPVLHDSETGIQMFEWVDSSYSLIPLLMQLRSRAICRYLAVKAGKGNLIPLVADSDYLPKLAAFEQAASIENTIWQPIAGALFKEGLSKETYGTCITLPFHIAIG